MTFRSKLPLACPTALAVVLCLAPLARAQEAGEGGTVASAAPATTNPNSGMAAEVNRFGKFLDTHPAIEARLRENAALLNDPVFLKNHPPLANFLTEHPNVRGALANRPRWFIHRELTRPTPAPAPASPAQVAELDRFLDQHPDISRQLAEKPQLLRQPQFLNSHPALRDYVKQHPDLVRPATPPKANAANKAAAPRANQSAAAGAKPLGTPAQRSNADDKSGTSEKTGATP